MDRTTWLVLGGVALVLILASRKKGAVDPEIKFGPLPPRRSGGLGYAGVYSQLCSPFDDWGGRRDSTKQHDASLYYVSLWGFDPPQQFLDDIATINPCKASEVSDELIAKYPPFPDQTLKASELAKKAKDQARRRGILERDYQEGKAACRGVADLLGTMAGIGGGVALAATGGAIFSGAAISSGKAVGDAIGMAC